MAVAPFRETFSAAVRIDWHMENPRPVLGRVAVSLPTSAVLGALAYLLAILRPLKNRPASEIQPAGSPLSDS